MSIDRWVNGDHVVYMCQFSSVAQSCPTATPWTAARQASLSITNSSSLLKLIMSIELMMPSNHLILCCHPLILPSIFPSIRVFSNESVLCIRWPKYWRFSFRISPSNEYSGLISFRINWFDLLAVQEIHIYSFSNSFFPFKVMHNIEQSSLCSTVGPWTTWLWN